MFGIDIWGGRMKTEKSKNFSIREKKDKQRFRMFASIFIILCVFIAGICIWYYGQVQKTVREESNGYLKEVATRIGSNVTQTIDSTYSMLYSFVNTLELSDSNTFQEFEIAVTKEKHWGYESVFLIDKSGNAYDVNGKNFVMNGNAFLQDVILDGTQSMSPLQIVNGKECAIFAVALEDIVFDGISMAALAVTYDTELFAQALSMSSFDNRAYSHIVSKDGTIIIRSTSEESSDFGYNVFSSIDKGTLINSKETSNYKEDVKNDRTGQIEFDLNGRREYMVYSPIPPDSWYLLTFVPTEVVNAKSNLLLMVTLLLTCFITVVFVFLAVLMLLSFRKYQRDLEGIAYVDSVTGGNTIERFYELASDALEPVNHPQYALIYTNISKFKVINENFGHRIGDEVLQKFYTNIETTLCGYECIGRQTADNFCILMEFETTELLCSRLEQWYSNAADLIAATNLVWGMPVTEFGIYVIENDTMPFPHMIDRAKLALHEVPHTINSKLRYAIYNDEVRAQLFREKHLEDMMEDALKNGEYKLYLQPKVSTSNEKVVGAEALTRWLSEKEGMIYPDEFIPLFEKNGFIVQLDLWIFEEVCKLIRSWLDNDETPIKISVNCSRVHIKDSEFVKTYLRIAAKHQVPPSLLEIELTENLVIEDMEHFKHVVREIHDAGFGCSMDDFGSGYSSLNMIKDLVVDTIKLDKIFFSQMGQIGDRTEAVVSNIIGMAKALSMETVAEGVEEDAQVVMLRRIGCDIIQGYVFARPMPADEFVKKYR